MTEEKLISVVIAIKDWDPMRLELAIRSHVNSSIGQEIEIIVSDYGSEDSLSNQMICVKYGCVYQYTSAEVWSRSRALNVGLSICTSSLMVTTDADIIFAPRTLEATAEFLKANPRSLVLNQCSDLSEDFSLEQLNNLPWSDIYADAVLRPRWGMGGLCAFTRDTFETVRGFEERMTVWGAEDNDYVKRCRQAGRFLHWISGEDIGIYHVWHPPFLQTDPKAHEIFENNKKILNEEFTTARNYIGPVEFNPQQPLVSIHVATYNRCHLIGEAIKSVLDQTVQDFELLIYDDGSVDDTEAVVKSFDDKRIRYINDSQNGGVANARNRMLEEARGQFVCVHDDDDIMLPNRLELQLNAMTNGYAGNYGGWVDFDASTGELSRQPGKQPFGIPSTAFVGSVLLHPTLMIKTDVMRRLGYETSFRGGSDFNLAFRLANAGYRLNHCGDYVILRRVHAESLTCQSKDKQKLSARITVAPFLNNISKHVETELRALGRKVKPVEITPRYDDQSLLQFMPCDLFDQLVDITESLDTMLIPDVEFYRAGELPRYFSIRRRTSNAVQIPTTIADSDICRVPNLRLDSDQENTIDEDICAVKNALCGHLGVEKHRNTVVTECLGEMHDNVQDIVEKHSHLINTFTIFNWNKCSYLAVDAKSTTVANFVLKNTQAALCALPKSKLDDEFPSEVTRLVAQS